LWAAFSTSSPSTTIACVSDQGGRWRFLRTHQCGHFFAGRLAARSHLCGSLLESVLAVQQSEKGAKWPAIKSAGHQETHHEQGD